MKPALAKAAPAFSIENSRAFIFELLLEGCTHPFDRDKKNKTFSGINSIQPYLDTALFGVLNHIPNNAKINKALRKKILIQEHKIYPKSIISVLK